jgi:hypothetical protein
MDGQAGRPERGRGARATRPVDAAACGRGAAEDNHVCVEQSASLGAVVALRCLTSRASDIEVHSVRGCSPRRTGPTTGRVFLFDPDPDPRTAVRAAAISGAMTRAGVMTKSPRHDEEPAP